MMGQVEQTYALPLDDVIQVLGASAATGVYQVQADVPASLLPSVGRRGHRHIAEVVIQAGQPIRCLIREHGSNTIVLEGANAFAAVRTRVQLVWQVRPIDVPSGQVSATAQARPTTVSLSSPSPSGWVARPPGKREPTAEQARHIADRRHRLVWMLIDGQRTLSDLAALLQMAPEEVHEALVSLREQGLIADNP